MRLYAQRRFIAGAALLAFLFAVAFPALAVAHRTVDPLAYAGICRIDTGAAGAGIPGSLQGKPETVHCLMCAGTASPPPVISVVPVVGSAVPELVLPADRRPSAARNLAALQPLHPRAPPRA
jgi:hypothetical protein